MIERGVLQLRHELKFTISHGEYRLLQNRLKNVLAPDPHCGPTGKYHIRSLYFDDCRNTALSEKLDGIARRNKYRMRIYNFNQEIIHLERKSKFDNLIGKESVQITRTIVDRILAGNVDFLAQSDKRLLRAFYLEYQRNLLRPNVIVDYYREAYIHPVGNVRVTFDLGLHTGLHSIDLFNTKTFTMGLTDLPVILEVKYDSCFPEIIRGLLSCVINPRLSVSKFVNCKRFTKLNDWEDE